MESKPGQGSTFWFTARLSHGQKVFSATSPIELTDAENILRSHYRGKKILLVEDNDINREVATELLKGANLLVESAENGRIAVEKTQANDYDLILFYNSTGTRLSHCSMNRSQHTDGNSL